MRLLLPGVAIMALSLGTLPVAAQTTQGTGVEGSTKGQGATDKTGPGASSGAGSSAGGGAGSTSGGTGSSGTPQETTDQDAAVPAPGTKTEGSTESQTGTSPDAASSGASSR